MIVSSSATRILMRRASCPEPHLGARAGGARQLERAAQLVANERTHDREARAVGRGAVDAAAVVGDREDDLAVVAVQVDVDVAAAVLERIPEQLREDERERRRAMPREQHGLERLVDRAPAGDALAEDPATPAEQ